MSSSFAFLLAPVVGLAAYVVSHLFVARLWRSRSPYPALMLGFFISLVATEITTIWLIKEFDTGTADAAAYLILNLAACCALGYGYFNFVNLTIASLRIRMLEEILEAGGHLSTQTLKDVYNTAHVMKLRIQRLVSGGHLVQRDGKLTNGKVQFLLVARFFFLLRRIILGKAASQVPGSVS